MYICGQYKLFHIVKSVDAYVHISICICECVKMRGHLQRILRGNILEGWQFTDILIIEPFDFEVKIHVFSTLTQAVLVMLCNAD